MLYLNNDNVDKLIEYIRENGLNSDINNIIMVWNGDPSKLIYKFNKNNIYLNSDKSSKRHIFTHLDYILSEFIVGNNMDDYVTNFYGNKDKSIFNKTIFNKKKPEKEEGK